MKKKYYVDEDMRLQRLGIQKNFEKQIDNANRLSNIVNETARNVRREAFVEFKKFIDGRIKEHKDCDKVDKYEEQHMEHSVVLAELKFIKSELQKIGNERRN